VANHAVKEGSRKLFRPLYGMQNDQKCVFATCDSDLRTVTCARDFCRCRGYCNESSWQFVARTLGLYTFSCTRAVRYAGQSAARSRSRAPAYLCLAHGPILSCTGLHDDQPTGPGFVLWAASADGANDGKYYSNRHSLRLDRARWDATPCGAGSLSRTARLARISTRTSFGPLRRPPDTC
jgi:hypothetical protein